MSTNLVSLRLASPKEAIRLRTQSQASSRPLVNSACMLSQAVRDHYCCPQEFLNFRLNGDLSADEGYFRFGPKVIGLMT